MSMGPVIDAILSYLAIIYEWAIVTPAVSWNGFTLTFFQLWVSFAIVSMGLDVFLFSIYSFSDYSDDGPDGSKRKKGG